LTNIFESFKNVRQFLRFLVSGFASWSFRRFLRTEEEVPRDFETALFSICASLVFIGKVPQEDNFNLSMFTTSVMVKEMRASDLWRLELIGITDPMEKISVKTRETKPKNKRILCNQRIFSEDSNIYERKAL